MRQKFLFFIPNLLFFCCIAFVLKAQTVDSIPYTGYRLSIAQIKTEKTSKDAKQIKFAIVNTGRMDVKLPSDELNNKLVLTFDASLKENELEAYKDFIRKEILQSKIKIGQGQMSFNHQLKIPLSSEEKPKEKADEVIIPTTTAQKEPNDDVLIEQSKKYCPDLIIDEIRLDKKKKKYIRLTFFIKNIGTTPVNLYGTNNDAEDNLAIKAFLSSYDYTTRGSIAAGGIFVEKVLDKQGGVLQPSESIQLKIDVVAKDYTRFTPYIVLTLDPFFSIQQECNKTNNEKAILIGEKLN